MRNHIVKTPSGYEIFFRYNPLLVAAVKDITGRRFVDDTKSGRKFWTAPLSSQDEISSFSERWKFEIIEGSESAPVIQHGYDFSDLSIPHMPDLDIPYSFRREPFPFQKQGIAYTLDKKRLIIGDQMGLGKTGQAIMSMTLAGAFPCLIICPATLRENWRREWSLWTDKRAVILEDRMKHSWPRYFERGVGDVFITNYESLKKYFVEEVRESQRFTMKDITFNENIKLFKSVIIDEAHRCKNYKTQQAKFVKGICEEKEYVLALTGTPVINKPGDLIAQLSIIDRLDEFGGYKRFEAMYCEKEPLPGSLEHLNAALRRTCFYRREKHDVLKDLPSKTRQVVFCDIDNRKEYIDAEMDLVNYLRLYREKSTAEIERSLRGEIMVKMGILKNVSARGKLDTVFEFIDDVMESGEKLVVFAHLKEVIQKIKSKYPHAVSITGEDSHESRQHAVDSFQNNEGCKLIICSIQAAGVGITLTAASRVAFVEFAWHPAIHDQAEDRCHRIGQQDNVQCTYFAGRNTIDEYIWSIIESKRAMTQQALGAQDNTAVDIMDDVMMLFEAGKDRPAVESEVESKTLF